VKKPVICHLSDFSPEYPGTFIDSLLFLARYCRDRMQTDSFCAFPEKARGRRWLQALHDEGVSYGFVPRTRRAASCVRTLLRDYDPLVFHTHFFLYDLCPVFLKLTSFRKAKIVWHYHDLIELTFPQRMKNFVKFQFIARYFGDRCIAVGDGVYANLIKGNFPREKLVLIRNGINTHRFLPNKSIRESVRESLGVSEGQTVFLLLGWEPLRKGVDIFIRAAAEAIQHNPNSLFLIVGRAQTRDFISNLFESSQFGTSLRMIDPQEDFSSLLNGTDVLVSASRREAFSYGIAEAMAAGKLILCSDIPGMREIYGNSQGVWFFPTEDSNTLSKLMRAAQENSPTKRNSLGEVNSRFVAEQYSLERWAQKVNEIYRSLLSA